MTAWIQYSLIRLAVFAGILAALLFLGVHWLLSAVIAALAGASVSYIFLKSQRDAVTREIADRVSKPRQARNADSEEDDALDRAP